MSEPYTPKPGRHPTDYRIESYAWAWERWLLSGELNLLIGAPATGKSALMTWVMACSLGYRPWPDGTQAKRGGFGVFVTSEESLSKSLMPQMAALGVPPDRWMLFDHVHADMHRDVLHTAYPADLRLVCVDPIIIGRGGDTNRATIAREIADDWQGVARALGCPVLASIHTVKSVRKHLEQGSRLEDLAAGSGQFVAVARMAWLYVRPEAKLADRILLRAKCSPHIDHRGDGYRVSSVQEPQYGMWQVSSLEELPDALKEARAMAADLGGEYQPAQGTAGEAILDYLASAGGSAPAAECNRAVRESLGVTQRGIDAAAATLVKHGALEQDGGGRGVSRVWRLPTLSDDDEEL